MSSRGEQEIFVAVSLNERQARRLREAVAGDRVHLASDLDDGDAGRKVFFQCGIAFGNPLADWVAASPNLQWLQLESTGFGEYAGLARLARPPLVTNLAGFFAEPVAESALAGILALLRGIDKLVHLKDERRWSGEPLRSGLRLLHGARIVLFGHGAINRRLNRLLEPFGTRTVVFDSHWSPDELDRALGEADIVACAVPDTVQTRGVFEAGRFQRLKRGAIFVNVGRGSLVDEAALAEALEGGRLGGAVIDVTADEPLGPGNPLWGAPNILLTQHTGGGTCDEIERKIDHFLANLARFRRREPLKGIVDFTRGY